ncbi:MAG: GntP family permease [Planctomycetales bacterium]|nr:GntP family permease [Planctomycetales bacterium]
MTWPLSPLWILAIGIATVLFSILVLRIHAFLALITSAMVVGLLASNIPIEERISKVAETFGTSAGKIGIVIALAAIIGKCLMDSGAADRIVRAFLGLLGERRASWALLLSGYVLSVPVFFDTVFYLLVPLARATRIRTGKSYVVYILAIIAGGVATHSLVPPTPGPLTAGAFLNVDIGIVMINGLVVALICSVIPLLIVGSLASRFLDIPMRETPDVSLAELENLSKRPTSELPSLAVSLAPIVLPVVLITTNTVISALAKQSEQMQRIAPYAQLLGNANLALLLSTIVSLWMLARSKGQGLRQLAVETQPALASAGLIILITAAGGAFGGMLQAAGVGEAIRDIAQEKQLSGYGWLFLAFGVASLLKVAQGSGTVSIVVTTQMLASMLPPAEELGFHYVYIVQAIGCGSMVGDWMNDSGFWVVCQMSGFTPEENLKTMSVLLAVMGFVGLATTVAMAWLNPMVG